MFFPKKITGFAKEILRKANDDSLFMAANDMTFRLLLALFPFLLFLMTVAGFFDLTLTPFLEAVDGVVPAEVVSIVEVFGEQVVGVQLTGLLYASLIMAIYSSTSGFRSLVIGINKAYGLTDARHFFHVWLISFLLMVVFVAAMVLTMVGLIFRGTIEGFLHEIGIAPGVAGWLNNTLVVVLSLGLVTFCVLLTNLIALSKKIRVKKIIPGSFFTVAVWLLASYGINLFVQNFSSMVTVYGSVAAIMVLMLWLNVICGVLLLGGAINAVLHKDCL